MDWLYNYLPQKIKFLCELAPDLDYTGIQNHVKKSGRTEWSYNKTHVELNALLQLKKYADLSDITPKKSCKLQ